MTTLDEYIAARSGRPTTSTPARRTSGRPLAGRLDELTEAHNALVTAHDRLVAAHVELAKDHARLWREGQWHAKAHRLTVRLAHEAAS
jgi:hypothetical protein